VSAADQFADVLLQRAALIARVARDHAPDPLAGLKVDDDDLGRLLRELPGLDAGDAAAAVDIDGALAPSVDAARSDLHALLDTDDLFAQVVRRCRLSVIEAEVLAVLAAIELDPRRQRLVAYLNDDVGQRRLTPFSLGLLFVGREDALAAIGPGGGLRRACLLTEPRDEPWAATPVGLAPSATWWLAGHRVSDDGLPPGNELSHSAASGASHRVGIVTVAGPDRVRRLEAAVTALEGAEFLVTPLPASPAEWDAVIRQASLAGLAVIVELSEGLPAEARDRIERADHLGWALSSPHDLPLASLPRRSWIDVPVGDAPATVSEWEAVFGDTPRTHQLSAEQLRLVSTAAEAAGGDVAEAVRRLAAGHIDQTAMRVRPARGWDDIVLDNDRMELLREVVARCRHRDTVFGDWGYAKQPSTGVVALFAGPSGTGKTLAAEIIAGALDLDLYKVDLANLVSKYIGETEKNLSQVFDAAAASNVVLFFDEADAILGKRSEVADAHDRYANIEVAYLLQRLERHDGLVVLATNFAKNIDTAFLRRIHVSVEFPLPEPAERKLIWQRSIPKAAPLADDADFDFLAQNFELSGGSIRNAALTAAFLAAEAGTPVDMPAIAVALKRELQKLGRLIDTTAFGPWAGAIDHKLA
jgi:AAA+ superfamily predicted ATPase